MKFAKLFEFENGCQLLVKKSYEDLGDKNNYFVEFETLAEDGTCLICKIPFGEIRNYREDYFNEISSENVERIFASVVPLNLFKDTKIKC